MEKTAAPSRSATCRDFHSEHGFLCSLAVDEKRQFARIYTSSFGCGSSISGMYPLGYISVEKLTGRAANGVGQLLQAAKGLEFLHSLDPPIVHGDIGSVSRV